MHLFDILSNNETECESHVNALKYLDAGGSTRKLHISPDPCGVQAAPDMPGVPSLYVTDLKYSSVLFYISFQFFFL